MASRAKRIGIIAGAGAGLGAAAAVALRRRWSRGRGVGPSAADVPGVEGAAFLEHLAEAVRIPTVSHWDRDRIERFRFAEFRDFLERTYPMVHVGLTREIVADDSLLYTWKGSDPDAEPFLLLAHQDVVPVEPGTDAAWPYEPFAGEIADGYLWGRGSLDDKGPLIAAMEAVEVLVGSGFVPASTVYLAFGHDEEVGGGHGAAAIAELLAERGVRLSFVLDEGGAVVSGFLPGVDVPLAFVGIGEKGYLDLELTATAPGGHSSLPPPTTAVGRIAAAVHAVEASPMPMRIEAQRPLLNALASVVGGINGVALRRPEVFDGLLAKRLAASPLTDALVRTSMAATMVSGGVKSNVLPTAAQAVINVRVLPGDTPDDVVDHVRRVVGPDVTVEPIDTGFTPEPPPLSSADSAAFADLAGTIDEVFPGLAVVPWVLTGATDSRHFVSVAQDVYRFSPFRVTPDELAGVHGIGERVRVADADGAVAFYRRLVERCAGG